MALDHMERHRASTTQLAHRRQVRSLPCGVFGVAATDGRTAHGLSRRETADEEANNRVITAVDSAKRLWQSLLGDSTGTSASVVLGFAHG